MYKYQVVKKLLICVLHPSSEIEFLHEIEIILFHFVKSNKTLK